MLQQQLYLELLRCYTSVEPDLIIMQALQEVLKVPAVKLQMYILVVNVFFIREEFQTVELDRPEYGFGHYRSPPLEILANRVNCKIGVISTSDSLDFTPKDLQIMSI